MIFPELYIALLDALQRDPSPKSKALAALLSRAECLVIQPELVLTIAEPHRDPKKSDRKTWVVEAEAVIVKPPFPVFWIEAHRRFGWLIEQSSSNHATVTSFDYRNGVEPKDKGTFSWYDSGRCLEIIDEDSLWPVCLIVLDFLHCKNIELETRDSAELKIARRRGPVPRALSRSGPRYHVAIVRTASKKKVIYDSGEESQTPLHGVRGHFKTYTSEKPLLGKIEGKFWWPAHMRGDKKYGEIIKHYEAKPQGDDDAQ